MSFFKKIFGQEEDKPKTESRNDFRVNPDDFEVTVTVTSETVSTDAPNTETNKSYNISDIKKESTKIKDEKGLLASVNYVKDFISQNNIEFEELISLLKKVIPYMTKEKSLAKQDTLEYIDSQINRYKESELLQNYSAIADIYSRVDKTKPIEYLESKLGGVESDSNKTIDHFDSLVALSDYYQNSKKSDVAFQTLRRATLLITNFDDKFYHIGMHRTIAERSATICLNDSGKPKYGDYLYFEIVYFILDIASDLTFFPNISSFFHRKRENWGFNEHENFDLALKSLKMDGYKDKIVKEIYDFSYNELPIKMGIPKEYLDEKKLDLLSSSTQFNSSNWKKYSQLQDDFNSTNFDVTVVHSFAQEVTKRYYDKANAT